MAKHPRKRQKKSHVTGTQDVLPLKAARLDLLLDDESKDDEERRLESMLFGVKYVPSEKGKGKMKSTSVEENEEMDDLEGEGRGLQHLLDQDLFFVDEGPGGPNDLGLSGYSAGEALGQSDSEESDQRSNSGSESDSDSEPSSSATSTQEISPQTALPKSLTASKSKKPAWVDPSDVAPAATVSLLSGPTRLRKLRQAVDEDEITSREYETRLRAQFERINPEPAWAKKARKKGKKGEEEGSDNEAGDEILQEGDGVKDMLASTQGLLGDSKKKGRKRVVLPQGTLAIERVRDANHSVQGSGSGEVRTLQFHPKPAVPVLAVGTADRRVRLFHIDGHLSPLLTTLHCPSLPLVSNTSVLFHPQGNSILLSGPRPFFYTYDLQQGTSAIHRRGLWGTGFDDSSILSPSTTINGGRNQKRRRR
ncbi:hypothetical protein CVT26_005672, partial [Gymnopilus dilepis]